MVGYHCSGVFGTKPESPQNVWTSYCNLVAVISTQNVAKIVPYGVSHVVACHTMWLFVLRGLLLVWKVVMELFGRFHVLIAGTELV